MIKFFAFWADWCMYNVLFFMNFLFETGSFRHDRQ